MSVTVIIPTPLRQFTGGESEIEVEATTAGEALEKLTAKHAELRKHLYNEQDSLRNFINVYVSDEDIRHLDGPSTPVKDGETIMIVPSIAGGNNTAKARVTNDLPELTTEEYARYSRHLILPEVGFPVLVPSSTSSCSSLSSRSPSRSLPWFCLLLFLLSW